MGLFDQFPYTNFHNLNLDWIIGQIKNIKSAVTSTAEDAASASESAEAAAASAGSAAESAESAGNAAALVQQVRDDLDTVNTEMTNFVQAHSGLFNETVLWTGTASAQGDTIELSDDIRNYKYIDVQATYKGATSSSSSLGTFPSNVVRFTPEMFTEDNAVLNIPYAYEDQLQICTVFMFWDSLDPTDYTKISLGYTRRVSINDHGDLDNAADPGTVIVKIVGVKNIADAEVIDARVGEDDTVYSTLKQRLDSEYSELKSAIAQGGVSEDIKSALLLIVNNVSWTGEDPTGQTYITALEHALYPTATIERISCVYTQSGVVFTTDPLNSLKQDLVVTAHYSDGTSAQVQSYTLSGTLTVGTSTITVTYNNKETSFNVTVTVAPLYPLAIGTHPITVDANTVGTMTLSSGAEYTHVKLEFTSNAVIPTGGANPYYFIRLNEGDCGRASLINNNAQWFNIPASVEGTLELANVVNASSIVFAINFRKANATASSSSFGILDGTHTDGETKTVTLETAESVGNLFFYTAQGVTIPAGTVVEFDVRFTLGGERYF